MADKPIKPDVIYHKSGGYTQIHVDPNYDPNGETIDEVAARLWDEHTPKGSYIPKYNLSAKEQAAQNYHSAMADALAKQNGKVTHQPNGLPGPVSSQPLTGGAIGGGQIDWRVALLAGLAFLGLLWYLCTQTGSAHAAPEYVGSMPYPVDWNRQFIEIRWSDVPQTGKEYYCTFLVQQQDGDAFVGITDSWLPYGDSVYLRMPFDFSGAKWFISELDCTIVWEGGYQISPPNPGRYYFNGISQIILTLVIRVTE